MKPALPAEHYSDKHAETNQFLAGGVSNNARFHVVFCRVCPRYPETGPWFSFRLKWRRFMASRMPSLVFFSSWNPLRSMCITHQDALTTDMGRRSSVSLDDRADSYPCACIFGRRLFLLLNTIDA